MSTPTHATSEAAPVGSQPVRSATRQPSTTLGRPRILLAEDNGPMCLLLAVCLEEAGYEVVKCYDGFQLVEHLGSYLLPNSKERVDLIISDIRMPHLSGLEVLDGLNEREDFPPVILITAFGDKETHDRARELGAVALFDKPFPMDDLVAKVREVVPRGDSSGAR